MENIKFIKEMIAPLSKEYTVIGDAVYFPLPAERIAKAWCEERGVRISVIHKTNGEVDGCFIPFANHFAPVSCCDGAPEWYQHIANGCWFYSKVYTHVLPTKEDYEKIAEAISIYLKMFE